MFLAVLTLLSRSTNPAVISDKKLTYLLSKHAADLNYSRQKERSAGAQAAHLPLHPAAEVRQRIHFVLPQLSEPSVLGASRERSREFISVIAAILAIPRASPPALRSKLSAMSA